jgi:hypothetical protein
MNEITGATVGCLSCGKMVKDYLLDEYLQCQQCRAEMLNHEPQYDQNGGDIEDELACS